MPQEEWFIHAAGETFGPMMTDKLCQMLKQNRFQFADFAWTEGFTKWIRISDIDAFAALMPDYPKVPIPSRQSKPQASVPAPAAATDPPQANSPQKAEMAPSKAEPAQVVSPPAREPEPNPGIVPDQKANWPFRRFVRVPSGGTVSVEGCGSFPLINISEGGIFIESANPIPVGTAVKFTMQSENFEKPFEMTGIVIRHGVTQEGCKGFAIQFTRVNPAYKRILHEYVKSKTPVEQS